MPGFSCRAYPPRQGDREHIEEDEVVEFLITYHCLDDEKAKADLTDKPFADKDTVWLLFCLLKDADCLDRVRFKYYKNGALNAKYLRMSFSKKLLKAAYELAESDSIKEWIK